jgi:hypothetical protein
MEVLLLSASPLTSAQQSQSNKPKYEFPAPQEVRIPLASEVDLSALPVAAEVPQVVRSMPPVIMNMSDEMYRLLKQESAASPDVTRGAMPEAPGLPSELRDTPSAVKSFPGVGQITAGCGGFIPSDGGFAVSSLYLVQVANSCIEVENATNGAVLSGPISLNTFFGFPAGHIVGDPRALYDWNAGRFIVIAEDFSVCPTLLGVAVSKTSNPVTGGWFIYVRGMGGFGDFPMMGQTLQEFGDSKGAIYLSWNLSGCTTNTFTNVIQIAGKTKAFSGAGLVGTSVTGITFGGVPLDTIQPVSVTGRGDRPRTEYLVSAANTPTRSRASAVGAAATAILFCPSLTASAPGGLCLADSLSVRLTPLTFSISSVYPRTGFRPMLTKEALRAVPASSTPEIIASEAKLIISRVPSILPIRLRLEPPSEAEPIFLNSNLF